MSTRIRNAISVGVVGDLHGYWDDVDVRYFNEADYDLLLFTGDLGSGTGSGGVKIAKSIARLRRPTLVIGGNNDVQSVADIAAEFTHQRGLARILDTGTDDRPSGLVEFSGFRLHPLPDADVTVLVGRPYSLGGPQITFAEILDEQYGVGSIEASTERLRALIDAIETRDVLVLSHNGPTGLGAAADAPWGRDFRPEAGDWGDADLADALSHARARGLRVRAVVAGHMHLRTKDGRARTAMVERYGTLYLNAARVPRISNDGTRHHLALVLDDEGVRVAEVAVP